MARAKVKKVEGCVFNLMHSCRSLLKYWRSDDVDGRVMNVLVEELGTALKRAEKFYGWREE